jgi:hypothetical protein
VSECKPGRTRDCAHLARPRRRPTRAVSLMVTGDTDLHLPQAET